MKRIEAIVRPEVLEVLRQHLEDAGYPGVMVTDIKGHGKQRGVSHQWRGTEYKEYFLPKAKLEFVVTDRDVTRIVKAIGEVCRTGAVGDGKIFVSAVEDAVRIRTGESGDGALA